jgi:hypothetical protein
VVAVRLQELGDTPDEVAEWLRQVREGGGGASTASLDVNAWLRLTVVEELGSLPGVQLDAAMQRWLSIRHELP